MPELLQKIIEFLNYASQWFEENIASGLIHFLKALGNLIIRILEFFIDVIKWLLTYLNR